MMTAPRNSLLGLDEELNRRINDASDATGGFVLARRHVATDDEHRVGRQNAVTRYLEAQKSTCPSLSIV
jgi:hypothetical protein